MCSFFLTLHPNFAFHVVGAQRTYAPSTDSCTQRSVRRPDGATRWQTTVEPPHDGSLCPGCPARRVSSSPRSALSDLSPWEYHCVSLGGGPAAALRLPSSVASWAPPYKTWRRRAPSRPRAKCARPWQGGLIVLHRSRGLTAVPGA